MLPATLVDLILVEGYLFSRLYIEVGLLFLAFSFVVKLVIPAVLHYRKCAELSNRACSSPRHWFFGHLQLFPSTAVGMKTRVAEMERLKGTFVTWMGPLKVFIDPTTPSTIGKVLYSNAPKDELIYGFLRPWIGDGLLTASGEKWQRNRKLLTPAFHFNVLKPYMAIYNQCAKVFVSKWVGRNGDALDVSNDVSKLTMDVMLRCAMSTETNCQLDSKNRYVQSVHEVMRIVSHRIHFPLLQIDWLFWLTPLGWRFKKAAGFLHSEGERMIRERREKLQQAAETNRDLRNKKSLDFIDILLRSKDEKGRGLSDKEMRDEVDTFLFEGHDTTASGISWLIYNLARHPHYQQKCREEVMKIIGSREEVEWDDLHQLTYLGMCIKESLRLHPPVLTIARKLEEKTTFVDKNTPGGKLEVDAGVSSLVQIYCVHRRSDVWENPFQYDPERFSTENVAKRDPLTFVAFSAGPRNCIGKTFAMNEIKVTLCHILRNFKLSVDAKTPETIERPNLVLRSESGINVRITQVK